MPQIKINEARDVLTMGYLGTNHWVHDVEVTNRDECVTIKSPASHIVVERIWCNQSGGSAIGSMQPGNAIENIYYKNVYTNGGNQMFMIKSNGGDGYLRNVVLEGFLGRGTAYGLNIDQHCAFTFIMDTLQHD